MRKKSAGTAGECEADSEIYISRAQAAEVLRIPVAKVAAWAKRGILASRHSQGGGLDIAFASAVEIAWLGRELEVPVADVPGLDPLLVGALKLAGEKGSITLGELRSALGLGYSQALALMKELQKRELLAEQGADGRHRYLGAAD